MGVGKLHLILFGAEIGSGFKENRAATHYQKLKVPITEHSKTKTNRNRLSTPS